MELEISKQEFEAAIPAAREPKSQIYSAIRPFLLAKADLLSTQVLGVPGTEAAESGTNDLCGQVRSCVKRLVCVKAFLEEMRGLDLVLTATGFGVVSTQNTAPASKQRVDALEGQMRRLERLLTGQLLTLLFQVPGWSRTAQRQSCVATLFYEFGMLQQFAGISHPKSEDWDVAVPSMFAADAFLRKHLGNAYMDELLEQLTSSSLTDENSPIVVMCQRYIGAYVAQNMRLKEETYMQLINRLEADLTKYPTYAHGEGYQLNHFTPYENHAEDSAFHFVG